MQSLLVMTVLLVLSDADRDTKLLSSEEPSALKPDIPKPPLAKVTKADEGTVVAGTYKTKFLSYTYDEMNATGLAIDVWYPVGGAHQTFPFISYAHGRGLGGSKTQLRYNAMLEAMSAFGYVIAAHESCNDGCAEGTSLPDDPAGFGTMYKQQLKVIEWANQQKLDGDAVFKHVNFDIGVGVSGHSMGGQATAYSSSSHGSGHGIKAAVMHNLHSNTYPAPIVPFLAFTGSLDGKGGHDGHSPPSMSKGVFDAPGANRIRGFVNKLGGNHFQPQEHPQVLAAYTAAWFKLFLDDIRQEHSVDYEAMIFGNSSNSLCHGGFGDMEQCVMYDGQLQQKVVHPADSSGAPRAWWSGLTALALAASAGMRTSRVSATRG